MSPNPSAARVVPAKPAPAPATNWRRESSMFIVCFSCARWPHQGTFQAINPLVRGGLRVRGSAHASYAIAIDRHSISRRKYRQIKEENTRGCVQVLVCKAWYSSAQRVTRVHHGFE